MTTMFDTSHLKYGKSPGGWNEYLDWSLSPTRHMHLSYALYDELQTYLANV